MEFKNSFFEAIGLPNTPEKEEKEEVKVEDVSEPSGKDAPLEEPEKEVDIEEPVIAQKTEPKPEVEVEKDVKTETKELDYKSFIEEHKETFQKYLFDYGKMDKVDVLKLKLKQDNEGWDDEDIKEELEIRYGVGVDKKEIDTDIMTEEEVKEAKAFNRALSEAKRAFKKDSADAVKYFEDAKGALELPKWEITQEIEKDKEEAKFTVEDYERSMAEQLKESKEKVWTPMLDNALSSFSSVSHQTKYTDNGTEVVLDVKYSLTEAEKSEIREQLIDYVAQPSDSAYIDDKGNIDLQRFVEDKAKSKYFDKLIQVAVREASANARKDLVKNELVNFDDGGRQKASGSDNEGISYQDFFNMTAQKRKSKDL